MLGASLAMNVSFTLHLHRNLASFWAGGEGDGASWEDVAADLPLWPLPEVAERKNTEPEWVALDPPAVMLGCVGVFADAARGHERPRLQRGISLLQTELCSRDRGCDLVALKAMACAARAVAVKLGEGPDLPGCDIQTQK